jgi:hypothetical protein
MVYSPRVLRRGSAMAAKVRIPTTEWQRQVLKAAQRILAARGGEARAAKLSARRRSEIARTAGKAGAVARWGSKKKKGGR